MPRKSIRGINAPLITHKLKDPTSWNTFDTYIVERGAADICFPVDFELIKIACKHICRQDAIVYKSSEFISMYSLAGWANT